MRKYYNGEDTYTQNKDAFNTFESIIDDAYDSKLPDDILIRAYFSIIELLKKYTGAGRNVVGFSEFFI